MAPSTKHRRTSAMAEMGPPPGSPSANTLVKSLVTLAHQVSTCEKPQVCQRKNAANIARRIKVLSPLFEELRDSQTPMPPSALIAFREVYHIMTTAKLLLEECRDASTFWSLLQSKPVSEAFHELTRSLAVALAELPLELLELSDEVREQVELLSTQVQRAKVFVDPSELALVAEVDSVLKKVERKEQPEEEQLRDLFMRLDLKNSRECEREILKVEECCGIVECGDDTVASLTNLIGLVRYGKCVLYGVTENGDEEEVFSREKTGEHVDPSGEVSTSGRRVDGVLNPPDEFRCPISLDLMLDPVIVSTGQTYDRASIARWIEAGHSTCPKSGQKLGHSSLIPNYALRSLISQWCDDHHVPFDKQEKGVKKGAGIEISGTTKAALEATKMTASFLVGKLATGSPEVKKQVAYELRLLAKCGMDNRMCIAEAGAIPHLVALLSSTDSKTQENAVTALLNLSIYDNNKSLIVEAGALDPIIGVLRYGAGMESRENAAATLFSLSVVDDYKIMIGSNLAAIPALVALLRDGTPQRGKKDAATALFNLAVYHGNKGSIISAGVVPILVSLLSEEEAGVADDALAVLAVLAGSNEGLAAIGESAAIPVLVRLLRVGSPKGRENSVAILHALCKCGGEKTISSVVHINTAVPSLYSLLTMGTPRAKRKASCLLKLFHKQDPETHHNHNLASTNFTSSNNFRQLPTRR